MLFTGTLMLFRNTSQSTVVLLSFLILIKYNCLAWPWKNWRFHPSQLLLPEMERTRRKSSKKQDLTSINQRRKTEVLYSVRCLYPAASFFDEFTRRIYTELGLKVLFLKHPLHSSQTVSVQFPLGPCSLPEEEGKKEKTSHCPNLDLSLMVFLSRQLSEML